MLIGGKWVWHLNNNYLIAFDMVDNSLKTVKGPQEKDQMYSRNVNMDNLG
jgi:hypothetical protein